MKYCFGNRRRALGEARPHYVRRLIHTDPLYDINHDSWHDSCFNACNNHCDTECNDDASYVYSTNDAGYGRRLLAAADG